MKKLQKKYRGPRDFENGPWMVTALLLEKKGRWIARPSLDETACLGAVKRYGRAWAGVRLIQDRRAKYTYRTRGAKYKKKQEKILGQLKDPTYLPRWAVEKLWSHSHQVQAVIAAHPMLPTAKVLALIGGHGLSVWARPGLALELLPYAGSDTFHRSATACYLGWAETGKVPEFLAQYMESLWQTTTNTSVMLALIEARWASKSLEKVLRFYRQLCALALEQNPSFRENLTLQEASAALEQSLKRYERQGRYKQMPIFPTKGDPDVRANDLCWLFCRARVLTYKETHTMDPHNYLPQRADDDTSRDFLSPMLKRLFPGRRPRDVIYQIQPTVPGLRELTRIKET